MQRLVAIVLQGILCVAVGLAPRAALAELFLLHNGGQVEGAWLNRTESTARVYVIQLGSGGRLTLTKDRVAEVVAQRPEQLEYQRLAPNCADTLNAQWKLAEWCRERNLRLERETHLRRILEIDPDHVKSRLALGYMHSGGRWITREDRLQEQGFELYQGRWRLVQEIELLEQRQKRRQTENEWLSRLKRMREALASDGTGKTYRQIATIRDPRAIPALAEQLANERLRPVRLLYVEVLGQIGTHEAVAVLVQFSVNDRDDEIRFAALEQIVHLQPPGIVTPYIGMLRANDNQRVNRAAFALAELGDQTAIEPLIEALVTIHYRAIRIGGSSDAVTAGFSKDSAGGKAANFVSGGRTEIVQQAFQNQEVLAALSRLTGGPSFGFNQQAWRNWYDIEKSRLETINARRDARQ